MSKPDNSFTQPKIVPVSALVKNYGVKCIMYGPPGTAKTPLTLTAPRPLLCSVEPGVRSLNGANLQAVECKTVKDIRNFFNWVAHSKEVSNFDTVAVDSLSHIAQVYLDEAKANNTHGLKAYGEMADECRALLTKIINRPQLHAYIICKQGMRTLGESGRNVPYFPGKDLSTHVPHEIDFIWHIQKRMVPGAGELLAVQTGESIDTMARSRQSYFNPNPNLDFFERPDLGYLFAKVMAQ